MPFINLIQEQRLETRAKENRARLFFLTFAGAAALSVGVLGFMMFENEVMKSQESSLIAKAQKLEPLVKRIKSNESDYAELQPRLTTLQNAQLVTDRWCHILDHLAKQTPDQTWLTSLHCSATEPTKPVTITFTGVSTQQQLVGDFIEKMQNLPDLTNVSLKYTMEKMIMSTRDIEFEVNADIAGTADQQSKDEVKKETAQ